jgi:hypothetical protein
VVACDGDACTSGDNLELGPWPKVPSMVCWTQNENLGLCRQARIRLEARFESSRSARKASIKNRAAEGRLRSLQLGIPREDSELPNVALTDCIYSMAPLKPLEMRLLAFEVMNGRQERRRSCWGSKTVAESRGVRR